MPKFVRVRDTSTGYEYDVTAAALPGLPAGVVALDDTIEGLTAQPRPPSYDTERHVTRERDPDMPAKSALKSEWVAYAVSRGMDPSTAESQTRDGLAAHFTEES
jgi:hypothetical protein